MNERFRAIFFFRFRSLTDDKDVPDRLAFFSPPACLTTPCFVFLFMSRLRRQRKMASGNNQRDAGVRRASSGEPHAPRTPPRVGDRCS